MGLTSRNSKFDVDNYLIWGFPYLEAPQNGWITREHSFNMDDFRGTPIYGNPHIWHCRNHRFFLGGSKKIGVTDAPSPGPEAPAGAQLLELHELPWPAGGDEITWGFNVVKPKAVNHPIPSGTFSLGWPFNAIQLYLRIWAYLKHGKDNWGFESDEDGI